MRMREDFRCLEMELPEYTAVLDELTKNTYIMVIVHDPTIGEITLSNNELILNAFLRNSCYQDQYQLGTTEVRGASS